MTEGEAVKGGSLVGDTGWVWGPGLVAAVTASCAARGGRTQLHWDENSK